MKYGANMPVLAQPPVRISGTFFFTVWIKLPLVLLWSNSTEQFCVRPAFLFNCLQSLVNTSAHMRAQMAWIFQALWYIISAKFQLMICKYQITFASMGFIRSLWLMECDSDKIARSKRNKENWGFVSTDVGLIRTTVLFLSIMPNGHYWRGKKSWLFIGWCRMRNKYDKFKSFSFASRWKADVWNCYTKRLRIRSKNCSLVQNGLRILFFPSDDPLNKEPMHRTYLS